MMIYPSVKGSSTLRESGVSASASKRKNKMNAKNDTFSKAEEEEEKIPEGEEDTWMMNEPELRYGSLMDEPFIYCFRGSSIFV